MPSSGSARAPSSPAGFRTKFRRSDVSSAAPRLERRAMPSSLVETYLSRTHASEVAARERRARSAADELRHVSFDRSINVPQDELCFFVFDAPSSREALVAAE